MNKIKGFKIFPVFIFTLLMLSCNDLNVPPWDKTSDEEVFTTENGIRAYMARLYADTPLVQFLGGTLGGQAGYSFTGEIHGGAPGGDSFNGWSSSEGLVWDYGIIRQQCYFLQTLPKYAGNFTAEKVNTWTAEVYFIRAFRYFEMVKRYGGVPIVKRILNYPVESLEEVTLPRNREKDCYDFILEDIDEAVKYFEQGISGYKAKGRANVHVARALKARVALHAASLAKYGSQEPQRYINFKNGLTGIAASEAKRYYDIAWQAAKSVIDNGGYSLYEAKADKVENYVNIFLDQNSNETIFAKYYDGTTLSTLYDYNNIANQYGGPGGAKGSPTLEFVQMFEDTDGNSYAGAALNTGTDDAPVLYNSPLDLFAKAEPRLRASVLLPGETNFKKGTETGGDDNVVTEVRYGILTKDNAATAANLNSANQDVLRTGGDLNSAPYEADGKAMRVIGKSGMSTGFGTVTGFFLRKWMDPSLNATTMFTPGSKVPWTEMRYAEVLLIAAEAAVELKELGDASHTGDAATYINKLRARAGAFNRNYSASTLTKNVVRAERRKELFMENKTYWDLIRWRTIDDELNNRYWSGIRPIYVWDEGKYYMQTFVVTEGVAAGATFNTFYYYSEIPGGARDKNKLLESNHD
jgi:hypothetical protein